MECKLRCTDALCMYRMAYLRINSCARLLRVQRTVFPRTQRASPFAAAARGGDAAFWAKQLGEAPVTVGAYRDGCAGALARSAVGRRRAGDARNSDCEACSGARQRAAATLAASDGVVVVVERRQVSPRVAGARHASRAATRRPRRVRPTSYPAAQTARFQCKPSSHGILSIRVFLSWVDDDDDYDDCQFVFIPPSHSCLLCLHWMSGVV